MKVKQLKEALEEALKQGKITEDSEVIAVGEYDLGMGVLSVTTDIVAKTDEEILEENINAFSNLSYQAANSLDFFLF